MRWWLEVEWVRRRFASLLIPVAALVGTYLAAPVYGDESAYVAEAVAFSAVLVALPGVPMVGLVRTRLLWWTAVAILAAACVAAQLMTVRSDDGEGLGLLVIPCIGFVALVVLGTGDAVLRRAARRRAT